jgi:hypothetical protein
MAVRLNQGTATRPVVDEAPPVGPIPSIDERVAELIAEAGPPTTAQFEASARIVASWRAEVAEKEAAVSRPRRRAA